MARTIRIAILGTGHMAQTFASAMESTPDTSLAGFVSRDPTRAADLSAAFGANGRYAALSDCLADQTVDAVYIANQTADHAQAALRTLDAGKAVLCEKPCGMSAADAQAIADAAARNGALFMEAIPTPFLPAVAKVLEIAKNGTLGDLRHLSASFGYPATAESHPGCFAREGGGVLHDRAIYLVTLALLALGPVVDVQARVTRNADGIDVETWIRLIHANGAVATLAASLTSELDNRLTLAGTSGTACVEAPLLAAERYKISTFGSPRRAPPPSAGLSSRLKQNATLRHGLAALRAMRQPYIGYGRSIYSPELMHFNNLIRTGATSSPVLPPSLSIAALTVLDEIRAAIR